MKSGSKNNHSGVVIGAVFLIMGLIFAITGLIGAANKQKTICEFDGIFSESDRSRRFVYFDVDEEPILVGEDEELNFYLLHGNDHFHIVQMSEEESKHVSSQIQQKGEMRITGVTKKLETSGAEAQIAKTCDDIFQVGVTAEDLWQYVGDVYLESMEPDYETVLKIFYSGNMLFGVIFLIVGASIIVCSCCNRGKMKTSESSAAVRKVFTYKGKWAWETAAMEYRRLMGKPEDVELTEEENDKIYDYTMMPLSFFFGWLCERNLIGEGFVNDFGEANAAAILERIKNGSSTPLETLADDLDYYFTEEWMRQEAKDFFWFYFVVREERYYDEDTYLYDYYECNGEPEDRYFCMEYSKEIQDKINQRLDERFAAYRKRRSAIYSPSDRYSDDDDDDHVASVHSVFFDKDLDVVRAGQIIKGEFPEDYALKCVKSLEQMQQKEWDRLERQIAENYNEEVEMVKINHFHASSIYIYEPLVEGDLAFIINGEADYEEEHGISFTIRNGIILDWSYYGESEEPYDEKLIKRYERFSNGIYFEKIKEQKNLEELLADGKLIRTLILPEWLGGEDTDSNKVFVTPDAFEHMQKIWKRIRMIKTYAAIQFPYWEFHVNATAKYCEEKDGTKALVPMQISYTSLDSYTTLDRKPIYFSMKAIVWER